MSGASLSLWMGDLEPYMDDYFITSAFEQMGATIKSMKLIKNKVTGLPAGYCFIDFHDAEKAHDAMLKLNGKIIPNSNPPKRFKLNTSSHGKEHLAVPEFSLFIGDLSMDVDDYVLYYAFAKKYRSCRSAKVVLENSGRSKGYGFVRFSEETDQQRALIEMQHMTGIGSKPIRVSLATPKRPMPQDMSGGVHYSNYYGHNYPYSATYYNYYNSHTYYNNQDYTTRQVCIPGLQHARYVYTSPTLQQPGLYNTPGMYTRTIQHTRYVYQTTTRQVCIPGLYNTPGMYTQVLHYNHQDYTTHQVCIPGLYNTPGMYTRTIQHTRYVYQDYTTRQVCIHKSYTTTTRNIQHTRYVYTSPTLQQPGLYNTPGMYTRTIQHARYVYQDYTPRQVCIPGLYNTPGMYTQVLHYNNQDYNTPGMYTRTIQHTRYVYQTTTRQVCIPGLYNTPGMYTRLQHARYVYQDYTTRQSGHHEHNTEEDVDALEEPELEVDIFRYNKDYMEQSEEIFEAIELSRWTPLDSIASKVTNHMI
ncbi:tRNA selenocysteine 1-associated protein 1-like isoform X44 [Pecten maximus]|uniref:tRNA selenocysteine 1-associated protein 1-like isoform X44 n=1 Tax=Pecten maximus TaxID=6579 RepID=UPI0014588571|nr:tRNA selenocysteine 1-associated protein 1-like isoform X44 [Pecten maximus]